MIPPANDLTRPRRQAASRLVARILGTTADQPVPFGDSERNAGRDEEALLVSSIGLARVAPPATIAEEPLIGTKLRPCWLSARHFRELPRETWQSS